MRITEPEREAIVEAILAKDPSAQIFLYGSRARDDLRGGDIDLLVVSRALKLADRIDALAEIKARIGEQKVDLTVVAPAALATDAFAQSVLPGAVRLTS